MPTTPENLQEAFAGESQANRKYMFFAEKAEQDGFPNVAKLFRTTAEAETLHARAHFKVLGYIKDTAANLQEGINGETYEFEDMYPPMLKQAEEENHPAKKMFGWAVKAEAVHAEIYAKALEYVKDGKDLDTAEIYLCPACGHIHLGKPTDNCPICGKRAEGYVLID